MISLALGFAIAVQRDYMEPRRFTGIVKAVTFQPYLRMTVAVPGVRAPLVLSAKGYSLFEDSALKDAALKKIKKDVLGKSFVVIVSQSNKRGLQDAISSTNVNFSLPLSLVIDGLMYADDSTSVTDVQRKIGRDQKKGFFGLTKSAQAAIAKRTESRNHRTAK